MGRSRHPTHNPSHTCASGSRCLHHTRHTRLPPNPWFPVCRRPAASHRSRFHPCLGRQSPDRRSLDRRSLDRRSLDRRWVEPRFPLRQRFPHSRLFRRYRLGLRPRRGHHRSRRDRARHRLHPRRLSRRPRPRHPSPHSAGRLRSNLDPKFVDRCPVKRCRRTAQQRRSAPETLRRLLNIATTDPSLRSQRGPARFQLRQIRCPLGSSPTRSLPPPDRRHPR